MSHEPDHPYFYAKPAVAGWQPIETAPKDGTWFVAVRAGEPDSIEIGCYDPLMLPRFEEMPGGLYRKTMEQGCEWRGFNNMHRMTHWMPLPEPPK